MPIRTAVIDDHEAIRFGVQAAFAKASDDRVEIVASAGTAEPHCGSLEMGPIRVMMMEHDRAGELLAALRERTAGYEVPDDGCASYRALYEGLAEMEADTHLHVHKENNVLFPAVIALEHAAGAVR